MKPEEIRKKDMHCLNTSWPFPVDSFWRCSLKVECPDPCHSLKKVMIQLHFYWSQHHFISPQKPRVRQEEHSPAQVSQLIHLDCTSIGNSNRPELGLHWDGKWCSVTHLQMVKLSFPPTQLDGFIHTACQERSSAYGPPQTVPRSVLATIAQTGTWSQLSTIKGQPLSLGTVWVTGMHVALSSFYWRAPGAQLNCDVREKK